MVPTARCARDGSRDTIGIDAPGLQKPLNEIAVGVGIDRPIQKKGKTQKESQSKKEQEGFLPIKVLREKTDGAREEKKGQTIRYDEKTRMRPERTEEPHAKEADGQARKAGREFPNGRG